MAKIIAQTKGGYLIDFPCDELARLVGFYFEGSDGCPRFQPGDEVQVSQLFAQLYELQSQRNYRIPEIVKTLTALVAALREIPPVLTPKVAETPA